MEIYHRVANSDSVKGIVVARSTRTEVTIAAINLCPVSVGSSSDMKPANPVVRTMRAIVNAPILYLF